MCEFEGQKRAFPRGKPGIFGRNFPEISGKIREIRENPGNSGNSGISQTTNLRNIRIFGQNRNFHLMCASDNYHIFVCFSSFTQTAFTDCAQCKNTQLNIDLYRCETAENGGEMCVYTNYIWLNENGEIGLKSGWSCVNLKWFVLSFQQKFRFCYIFVT